MSHRCHALGCKETCQPAHLMCGPHWAMVPPNIQVDVNTTVRQRSKRVDASWAPWWRAQARAIFHVARAERSAAYSKMSEAEKLRENAKANDWLRREMEFADRLEKRGVP